jgi:hypothetical protein
MRPHPRLGQGALTSLLALVSIACNAPLPDILSTPRVLEPDERVVKRSFALLADEGRIHSLATGEEGEVVAVTGSGAFWFDRNGEPLLSLRFAVDQALQGVEGLRSPDGGLGFVGRTADGGLVVLSPTGEVTMRHPGGEPLAIGDVAADGDFEIVRAVRRDLRCPWPRLCTSLAVSDPGSEVPTVMDTPFILTDLAVTSPGAGNAGQIVLMMYPNDDGGSRFEVWNPELTAEYGWDTPRVGDFDLVRRGEDVRVLTAEGDRLVFRDLRGQVVATRPLLHAGELRTPHWGDLGGGYGVAAVSGRQAPRFLVALFDPAGETIYREVGAPHVEDLLVIPDGEESRIILAVGSELVLYTFER